MRFIHHSGPGFTQLGRRGGIAYLVVTGNVSVNAIKHCFPDIRL